jgi:hypothetical protein
VCARYPDLVKYFHQENAGVGAARNAGIRHASGEFVAFLDSDDRWRDFKLSMQLELFRKRPDLGLVFSDFVIERPNGATLDHGASVWAGRDLTLPDMQRFELVRPDSTDAAWPVDRVECWVGPMYRQLINELPILTSSVVVRRSVLDATTWYTEKVVLFEDWEFFARVARRAPVGYVNVPAAVNVGHEDPGRVSKCSALDRAHAYRTLLERVWLGDQECLASEGRAVRAAYSRALLAAARQEILRGNAPGAREMLATWARTAHRVGRPWAQVYAACAFLPGGRSLLRQVLRARGAVQMLSGASKRSYGAVHPAV